MTLLNLNGQYNQDMFARIAINIPVISNIYDYSVPAELAPQIQAGSFVVVPFGNQIVQGIVMEISDSSAIQNPKPLLDLLDSTPVLTPAQLALATHLAQTTLTPLASTVHMMIPSGISQQADVLYQMATNPSPEADEPSPATIRGRLINLLRERGALRGRQIDSHISKVDWRKTASLLGKQGLLKTKNVLPAPRVRPKYIRVAQLSTKPETAAAEMDSLGSTKQTQSRREAALRFLMRQPEAVNLSWIYAETGCNISDLQELEERGLIRLFESEIFRDPLVKNQQNITKIDLQPTPEQEDALRKISAAFNQPTLPFLLYGVTGSGKTEVYLRAAEEVIQKGRQVIILVPEIALTPQLVNRFLARFPGQVGLVHSKLSEGERYDTWRRARDGRLNVVIGARSALFSPLPKIGLIVVDECHDSSYYQSEPPYYNAMTAAQEYARFCGAVCVLGSATPSMELRFQADHGRLVQLNLPKRVTDSVLPPVQVVDMRNELKSGNRGIFSRNLTDALAETLLRREQAILFLNRRGTATYIFCRTCGIPLQCPNCETPLTLHVENQAQLLCHRCGYRRMQPKTCPQCSSPQIREYGLGSEKVEAEIKALFPQARTLRWDWDTTRKKNAHEIILTHFSNRQADILVGTQMLAKGLDLPMVTLVGIVLAEVGLNLPDPFANEKVFQTLTQVAGRAGRSARGGKVILQTFTPEHYAIQYAAQHDVDRFYRRELEYRKQLHYPPYARLARVEFRHKDSAQAEESAKQTAITLKSRIEAEKRHQTDLVGPVPCFFSKENNEFRWQILIRGPEPASLLRDVKLNGGRIEIDPINLL